MFERIRAYARTFAVFGRDARLYLLTSLVFGLAFSLFWVDFNLYLEALGVSRPTIGVLMAVGQVAGMAAALPASALSDRIGRRPVIAGGTLLTVVALLLFLGGSMPLLFLGIVAYLAGAQAIQVVQVPFVTEHTAPEHRNEYFAALFAIGNMTTLVAALVGGSLAGVLAERFGLSHDLGPYQVLLVAMVVLTAGSLVGLAFIAERRAPRTAGAGRLGLTVRDRRLFVRLLLPGFLTALGAGQLIPYLNIFIEGRFHLDLTGLNAVFAVTSLGTAVAVMLQPALARRFGAIGSVVLVQAASLPFLVTLGFSPVLWTVIVALAVRNSLMNAGGPIFDAFAMGRVSAPERATLAAASSLLWSLGWAIGGPYFGLWQGLLGFDRGFAVDFVTIVILYSTATGLLWRWFGRERAALPEAGTASDQGAIPASSCERPDEVPTAAA